MKHYNNSCHRSKCKKNNLDFHCRKTLAYQSKLNEHLKLRNFFKREKFEDHSNEKIRKKRWSISIYNWGWVTEIFYLNIHQWSRSTLLCSRNVCETGKNVNREKNIFKVMRDEVEDVWGKVEAYNDLMKLRISTLIILSPFLQEITILIKTWR